MTAHLAQSQVSQRRTMSRSLLQALNGRHDSGKIKIGQFLSDLGERSFGWSVVLFAMVNLLPLPFGFTVVTSLPLILVTVQMALGFSHVRLPGFICQRAVPRAGLRRVVIRLRPIARRIEKVIRPRHLWLFQPPTERMVGLMLLAISVALFLPIPMSGWLPAIALFTSGFGLVERDGLITVIGLAIGAVSIVITAAVAVTLAASASALF